MNTPANPTVPIWSQATPTQLGHYWYWDGKKGNAPVPFLLTDELHIPLGWWSAMTAPSVPESVPSKQRLQILAADPLESAQSVMGDMGDMGFGEEREGREQALHQSFTETVTEQDITDDLLRQALNATVTQQMHFEGERMNAWIIQDIIFVSQAWLQGAIQNFICTALKKAASIKPGSPGINFISIMQERGLIKPLRACILQYNTRWEPFSFTWLAEVQLDNFWTNASEKPPSWNIYPIDDYQLRALETRKDMASTRSRARFHWIVAAPSKLPLHRGLTAILPNPHVVIAIYHEDPFLALVPQARSTGK